jgi:hypothetical protein
MLSFDCSVRKLHTALQHAVSLATPGTKACRRSFWAKVEGAAVRANSVRRPSRAEAEVPTQAISAEAGAESSEAPF